MISERYKLCNSNLSIAGPYVVDINGTVYKNKFCAECHNVFNYKSFTVKITINHRKTDKQYIEGLLMASRLQNELRYSVPLTMFVRIELMP
jgi:hypothetical protein